MSSDEGTQKKSHGLVGYEHPARGMDHCRDCQHFEAGQPPHCQIVKDPIRPYDWCIEFKEKK